MIKPWNITKIIISMEFIFEHKHAAYPYIWDIRPDDKSLDFYLISSPFGNCQTSCLNYAKYIKGFEDEDIPKLIKGILELVPKKQMVIDIRMEDSPEVIAKLKPYFENIISTEYVSTNGSNMVMHLIQWDSNKVFDL